MHIGLLEESLEQFHRAVDLDPRSPDAASRIPRVLFYQHKYEEALVGFERVAIAPTGKRLWRCGTWGEKTKLCRLPPASATSRPPAKTCWVPVHYCWRAWASAYRRKSRSAWPLKGARASRIFITPRAW